MNVAYDKLGLVRPADEPAPNFGGFTDQPFLDEMADKAIQTLSKNGSPFILMVEGASIDKQSHPNHAAGVIWDTIEFDKSVAVSRAYAATTVGPPSGQGQGNAFGKGSKTLVLVTADHDQSMQVIGLEDTNVGGAVQNTRSNSPYPLTSTPPPAAAGGNNVGEADGFPDYQDVNHDGYPENTNRYRIAVGFRTGNHTGQSVPITAEGPGALLFTGYFDQTDVFFKMARVLSTDTQPLDKALKQKEASDILGPNY
jgi:alkaline phosphatase